MKASGLFTILVGGGMLMAGRPSLTGAAIPSDQEPANPRSFTVQGVVKELRTERQSVLVAHEPISGYMDAMTMPFRVKEPETLAALQAGDRISFQLHVEEERSWIDHIVKTGLSQGPEGQHVPAQQPQVVPPKPRHPLLEYRFTNELGQAVSLNDFRGQALAITFFFTRCPIPDYCPRLSRNFEEASQKLLALTNAPSNWHFLSFSFDPEFDTPARLKAYAEHYHYVPQHWSFLTGAPDKLAELAAQADVTFERDGGFFSHNFRTLIIDAAGHLQMTFPMGGDLSEAIVSEILKAAAVSHAPVGPDGGIQGRKP